MVHDRLEVFNSICEFFEVYQKSRLSDTIKVFRFPCELLFIFNCKSTRLTPVDLVHLAKWILEKPFFINLTLDDEKIQISHAQTYLAPEKLLDKGKFYMGDDNYELFIDGKKELKDLVSVVGHKPTETRRIWTSPTGKTIRIDCGAGLKSYNAPGSLGAIRLNDRMEFYV